MKIYYIILGFFLFFIPQLTAQLSDTIPPTPSDTLADVNPIDSMPEIIFYGNDNDELFDVVDRMYATIKSVAQNNNRSIAINQDIELDEETKILVFEKNVTNFAALTDCYNCTYNDVIDGLSDNPFFAPYLPQKFDSLSNRRLLKMFVSEMALAKSYGNPASNGWSRISDGLAKFLVSRTKAELNAAFLENFSRQCNTNPYLKGLFPNTGSLLSLVHEKAYNINPFLTNIRDAVHADFKSLPEHITTFLETDTTKWIDEESRMYLTDAAYVNRVLFDPLLDPGTAINYFAQKGSRIKSDKMKTAFIGFSMLAAGYATIRDVGDYRLETFAKDYNEDEAYKAVFLGVFYQRHKSMNVGEQTLGKQLTAENGNQFFNVFTTFARSYVDAKHLFSSKNDWQADHPETVEGNPKLHDYLQLLTNTIDGGRQFMVVLQPQNTILHDKMQRITNAFSYTTSITQKVSEEKWGEALLYTGTLIVTLTGVEDKISCQFIKYGSFMASIVNCSTSDEIAAIIETFALPVGSSRAKKKAKFSIDIGAYVGGYGGLEFLKKVPSADRVAGTMSMHAPVGLAFSWGRKNWSYTGYATLIDVGAFTAFRFDHKDYIDELPELSFSNIFAPGAAFIAGVPKYPIAFGLNAQVGPNIRGITENGIYNFKETGAWRFGATLLVDIPLFNFYANGEKFNCRN